MLVVHVGISFDVRLKDLGMCGDGTAAIVVSDHLLDGTLKLTRCQDGRSIPEDNR